MGDRLRFTYRWWQVGAHPRLWAWITRMHDRGGWRWRLFLVAAAPLFAIEAVVAPVVSRIWPSRGHQRAHDLPDRTLGGSEPPR